MAAPLRAPTLVLLAALALLGPLAPAPHAGGAPRDARALARLELDAPRAERFTLRATVPLDDEQAARDLASLPFAVVSQGPGGGAVPAQAEVVVRGPSGAPEVIEVVARVERAADARPGAPPRYELVERAADAPPGSRGPFASHPDLARLLAAEPPPCLRARDVFGNEYRCELRAGGFGSFAARTLADGPFLRRRKLAGVLLPVGEPAPGGAPLPHMLGVHAYLTEHAEEDVLGLVLRLHNGLAAGAREEHPAEAPVGTVYFQSLELELPAGWVAAPLAADPFFRPAREEDGRSVVTLVAPYDDGALHLVGPQGQLHRRLALAPAGGMERARARVEQEGLAFCAYWPGHLSWAEPDSARYFPQRDLVGSLDFYRRGPAGGKVALRAHEALRLEELRAQLETGASGPYPARAEALGWAHPWFVPIEGGVGGEGVQLVEGHRAVGGASRASYLRLALVHRRNQSRQPEACFDRFGEPVGFFEWRDDEGRVPFVYRTHGRGVIPRFRLPCFGGPPASEQVRAVAAQGRRPPYDMGTPHEAGGALPNELGCLLAWMPHDGQHLVRYTKQPKALVWLGNDPLAKDDLRLSAELFQLYVHEGVPARAVGKPLALRELEALAAAHPHEGLPINRDHAWGIDAFCAAYSTADDAWRARHLAWARRMAELLVAGATPSGILIRSDYPGLLQNPKYEGAHAFQSELLMLAQRSLYASVFDGVDGERAAALRELYLRTADYLFWGPVFQRQRASWSSAEKPVWLQGPRWAFAIALNDGYEEPPFSEVARWGPDYLPADGQRGGVETSYGYAMLSFAADWTQASAGAGLENRYLRRTLEYGRPSGGFPALVEALQAKAAQVGTEELAQTVGFLARLQRLGVGAGGGR